MGQVMALVRIGGSLNFHAGRINNTGKVHDAELPALTNDSISRQSSLDILNAFGVEDARNLQVDLSKKNQIIEQQKMKDNAADRQKNNPIPLRYQCAKIKLSASTANIQSCNLSKNYAEGLRYIKGFDRELTHSGRGLLLWGGVGSGKTQMACAIANELMAKGNTVLYSTSAELTSAIISSRSFKSDQDEFMILKKYAATSLLIIDEISRLNVMELSILSTVIDMRYRNLLPIIAISNYRPDQLRLAIGDMAMSRIIGHDGKIIHFDQDDMRMSQSIGAVDVSKKNKVLCLDEEGEVDEESDDEFASRSLPSAHFL